MIKFKAKAAAKANPQRQAAEQLLQQLKPTLEMEAGRGSITITHYLQARGSQTEEDYYPQTTPGTGFYSLDSVVATGGMGAILRAFDNNLQREVALKVMLNSADATSESVYGFVTEAQITGQLEHPNIVPLHDIGVAADGTIYYTMKMIEGRTLREILKEIRDGNEDTIERYPIAKLLTVFQKVCDGMAYAHSRLVVHRDLKPDNVMVGEFGEVLILDWGLAKVLTPEGAAADAATTSELDGPLPVGADGFATMAGQVKGTPNYMAPEQAEGRVEDLDGRTDIYALGGILYVILTLHPPITGSNLDEILTRVTTSDIMPPISYNSQTIENPTGLAAPHCPDGKIPSALSAVAMKCMAYANDDRYQFVEALQGDIAAYQGGYATMAEDAGLFTQVKLLMQRNKKEVFFIFLIIAAIFGTGVAFIGKVKLSAFQADEARKEAEGKVEELRKTAPAFQSVAKSLIRRREFTNALERIDYAIALDDSNADFYNTKGNIYQGLLDFDKAYAQYKLAYEMDPTHKFAQINSATTAGIVSNKKSTGEVSIKNYRDLHADMVAQNRIAEAFVISQILAKEDEGLIEEYREKLKQANLKGTLTRDSSGFHLDLSGTTSSSIEAVKGINPVSLNLANASSIRDLSPLDGSPIEELDLSGTAVSDLAPLKNLADLRKLSLAGCLELTDLAAIQGMDKIEWLDLSGTKVTSLEPLVGMPLKHLDISNTMIRDLKDLNGMPLEWLNVDKSKVIKVDPLKGMPLDFFSANECNVRSIDALADSPLTQEVGLNRTLIDKVNALEGKRTQKLLLYKVRVSDLSPLKNMPLTYLDLRWTPVVDIGPLAGMPLDTLLLSDTKVENIESLRGAPFKDLLDLANTKVSDLSPLRGAPLKKINLSKCPITSVKPLENMPLTELRLDECPTQPDLNPLWYCQELEHLSIPFPSPSVITLRQLPKLKRISYRVRLDDWVSGATTPTTFWKDWDARN